VWFEPAIIHGLFLCDLGVRWVLKNFFALKVRLFWLCFERCSWF